MKRTIIIFFLFFAFTINAQIDSTDRQWTYSAASGINISQIALSNWTQGGDNAISWVLIVGGNANYKYLPWNFKNTFKLGYGRTKLGSDDYRTNDNEIFLETVLSYNIGWILDPYFSNTVRTLVSTGYDYKQTPVSKTADFFDPGYITQSIGFAYNKSKTFTTRLGLGFQETFTNKYRIQYSDDPKTTDKVEAFKFDTGIESVTNSEFSIDDNVLFTTMLRLFSSFKELDVWDVRWDNTLTAKVSKYFSVNVNILTIYEKRQSPKTQLKEGLQLGITYTWF
ncbi:MAG: DUF3078 domain-containing protein [Ignavibacteriales bacterium]|nr:DUF3078 domain-containing protein [Ignavibacteriales bacterium]